METNTPTQEAPAASVDPKDFGAQPEAPTQEKTTQSPKGKAQADKPASLDTPENGEKLRLILRREKEDPNVQFSDAELDLLEAHYAGKLKPAKKQATPKEPPAPKAEEHPISEPKSDEDEAADEEDPKPNEVPDEEDEEQGSDAPKPDPDAEALMKEVGAKSLKDAVAKVKELRSKLGGKDAQKVAELSKKVDSEALLWQHVSQGVPDAIAHAEKAYGIKIARAGAEAPSWSPAPKAGNPKAGGRTYIDENLFIDPESAKIANEALRSRDLELDELKGKLNEVFVERDRNRHDTALTKAQMAVVDEMVTVAQRMDALKAIPNLREAIGSWYDKKTPDTRLEVFSELFEIANREGCSLTAAANIKRGLDAERLVAEAEERGRKAAYGHKPNPSLSGSQGGRNEQGNYSPITDAQIEAMAEDHTLIPPDWYDEKDNLVKTKVPKRAWAAFGL